MWEEILISHFNLPAIEADFGKMHLPGMMELRRLMWFGD